jgi:hypothetical protein
VAAASPAQRLAERCTAAMAEQGVASPAQLAALRLAIAEGVAKWNTQPTAEEADMLVRTWREYLGWWHLKGTPGSPWHPASPGLVVDDIVGSVHILLQRYSEGRALPESARRLVLEEMSAFAAKVGQETLARWRDVDRPVLETHIAKLLHLLRLSVLQPWVPGPKAGLSPGQWKYAWLFTADIIKQLARAGDFFGRPGADPRTAEEAKLDFLTQESLQNVVTEANGLRPGQSMTVIVGPGPNQNWGVHVTSSP